MSGYIILRQVKLSSSHNQPTGKTHHYHGKKELPAPAMLQIAKYSEDPGYYLLYLDANGNELTDTYHDSMEEAIAQAEWEFQVKPSEWE